ncbi:Vacuolar protein sorting-associated protein 13 [Caenorhabditis elegans]|uniref:Vacuolar protein sorting-associated protein 13 n=1 Tax=Caenorhabditis elegans TaxID=6239 RepID=Q8T3D2_CAEEL|nr:Vacuolar protein sorting-associated protein 13 [Caenorhabditis elegans]CAD27608.1 Vacuolar protein sorting-associated protein 13 [Caenorhabditis elegans]|eukprot:NP_740899.1 Uncharacterized protein CELE_T08G11.1 [Caenorhabditis elegans]
MVFESLVADLLNRFLGDFVDNLDSSQLNIGIWGGDVKLDNLQVKETALDDFDLPIKLKYGYLSSLVLKIPWKNLYNEPVIATVDGLNLIVVPNKGVVYNEEKVAKNIQEIKQKTLARLEEARKERRKPKDPQADTFTEKMITQIIKNLQISVSNIHVRFEDRYTNRHRPFAMGITLEKLNFKTTDENWRETIHKDVVKIIYKLVSLQNLAIYWNSSTEFISDLDDKEAIRKKLQETIHNGKNGPEGYNYILEPIQMEAKLKLNQKPETDGSNWKIPKIDLAVDMHALSIAIGKFQYQDVLLFLEAQERFNAAGQYLKYRPNLNEFKGHYKAWWKFAYTSILEEKVRRRRNNWSWDRMQKHRQLVRKYQKAWVRRQTEASPGADVQATIKEAEKKLDVFNVNVARQQAELEIDREGLTRQEDKPTGWVAWGKSWFGGGGGPTPDKKKGAKDIGSQFQEAMTPEEKAKLFEAIDYQENIPPTNYPKEFVENKFDFKLGQVAIVVDGAVSMQLLKLVASVEQRPSASAMHVESSIQELRMDGCGTEIIRVRDPSIPWMSFLLDTNPLKGNYDQLVKLAVAPINIKYQAPAINNAIDVFKPPESVRLNQLTALAMSRYEEVKARSATGLAYAVEHRSRLVLDVQIQPARIYVSEGGTYSSEKPTLLADMGLLSVVTVDNSSVDTSGMNKMAALMEKAYDRFHVKLSNVVIAFAENVETAENCVFEKESPLHVLKPTGLDIQIHKSSIDDLKLAKMRVIGDLPNIVIGISDDRLIGLMKLGLSIPTPKADEKTKAEKELEVPVAKIKDRAKMRTIMEVEEMEEDVTQKEEGGDDDEKEKKKKTSEQQVQIELDLRLNQIGVVVYRKDAVFCDVSILKMACKLQMRTFDMVVTAELGSIKISMPEFKSLDEKREHLYLIDNDELQGALMTLKFVQANPESPFFATEYALTEQSVDFRFTKLAVSLHQEGVLELKAFGEALQAQLNELQKNTPEEKKVEETARKISRKLSDSVMSIASMSRTPSGKEKRQRKKTVGSATQEMDVSRNIKQRIKASFGSLALMIGTQKHLETSLAIENINANVKITEKAMEVVATLRAISMKDRTPGAVYKKLLSVTGKEDMLRFDFVQYQRTDEQRALMKSSDVDMVVKMRLAQMRFVFLNLWLARLMAWLAPFQNEAVLAAQAAQAAAAEKAATAAQNVKQIMEQSPPRIQLDVILEAPFIVVPRLSTSRDVIVLHLGRLALKNEIRGDSEYPKAIIDRMDILMTDCSFGMGVMNEDVSAVSSSCLILKPISFKLALQRNLTFAVAKELPEIVVDAHIHSIEAEMSDADYKTLMQTLSGNLAEGADLAIPPPPPPSSLESSNTAAALTSPGKEKEKKDREANAGPPVIEKSHTRIVFQFVLDKISAVLYEGEAVNGERKESDAFAALRLKNVKTSGKIGEDNSIVFAMSLDAFTMDDERKEKTKISKLMDKKGSKDDRFLDMSFNQDAEANKQIRLKMSAFFICLCPEFLGCLTRFFNVPQSEEQLEKQAVTANVPTKAVSASPSASSTFTGGTKTSSGPPQPVGTLAIDCDMHGVEVILVEDSMHPESTQALILSFNVTAASHPNEQTKDTKMNVAVENLTIFSSYYQSSRRNEVTYQVLTPVRIEALVNMNTERKTTDAVLKMSALDIKMSPSIIRLLSAVSAEFSKSSAPGETGSISQKAAKLRKWPNYFDSKPIDHRKYWFFAAPVAQEAVEEELDVTQEDKSRTDSMIGKESAKVDIERISFTLEAGTGAIPVPLIFLDMLVNAEAYDWSSAMRVSSGVSVQMSYYNESVSVWEPIIEPVENEKGEFERWKLAMTMKSRNKQDSSDSSPQTEVKIEADKMLNVTVTKSLLSLLNKLSEVFATAAKQITPTKTRHLPGISPFVVLNETGISVKVLDTETIRVSENGQAVDATHGEFVDVFLKNRKSDVEDRRLSIEQEEITGDLKFELAGTVRETKIGRAEKRVIHLPRVSDGGHKWLIVAETTVENSRRLVTLNSHVKFTNHLSYAVEIYSKRDTTLDLFGTVEHGETIPLAVPLLFSPSGDIYLKPVDDKYEVSFESLCWHNFEHNRRQAVRCEADSTDGSFSGIYIDSVVHEEKIQDGIDDQTTSIYHVHLHPPLEFHNNLPFDINIELPEQKVLGAGMSTLLNVVAGSPVKAWLTYLGEKYVLDMSIPEIKKDVEVVALNTETGSDELLLGLHWTSEYGDQKVYLYAPFWLVNNTDKMLRHVNDDAVQHLPTENPIILPFPAIDLSKKKKARVRIENLSEWSEEFPLDTVGNAARITCKGSEHDFDLTVDIKLCQSGLTKIVTFAPFYLVSNLGKNPMEIREEGQKGWVDIPAETCVGIWPVERKKRKLMCVRYKEEPEAESLLFPITENYETLCHMDGEAIGVEVSVSTGESSVAIHLSSFVPGMCPVQVMNNLTVPVTFGQKGHIKTTVGPNEFAHFSWSSIIEPKVLEVDIGDWHFEDKLDQNRFGDLQIDKSVRRFSYYSNFLIGRQRVLLFTPDVDIAKAAYGSWETDVVDMQAEISLQGFGLSVVDNIVGREIIYMAISSSDILWEEEVKKGRFKPLAVKYMQVLEEKYQAHLVTPNDDYEAMEAFEVNVNRMIMKKKKGKEVKLRRIFEKGLWACYGKSSQRTRLHAKINHIQIDNQLDACIFPRVLSVVPPPKSVIVDNTPKPFIELSLLQRQPEFSSIAEIEYGHVLIQEFSVQVDQGLINALLLLISGEVTRKPYGKEMFDEDIKICHVTLSETASTYRSQRPKSFYNDLHISPIMMHLSFSQGGTSGDVAASGVSMPIQSEMINVLLRSVGVTLTELQDVVFKLAYFERKCVFYSPEQLNSEIISHYAKQFIKQVYVLVLGLDIIGNPFGLVRDLSAGVEDLFYQPFQGAIQGPEEFAAGVALGVQSMFGHAVGGAAGAVGRITGTVGKGVAALTFDDDYMKKRQEDLNRKPQSFGEGMARGLKGLGMGVVGGITGVVTKPIEGAKQEGGFGFVKGVGKGLIGVVTRPVSGVVDFASGTMNSVRAVAGTNREAGPLRPPRVLREDKIVKPYSSGDAYGFKVFKDTDRGELAETDEFVTYASISEKMVLIITDRRLVLSKRTDMMGVWQTEWGSEYCKIKEPEFIPNGVKILLKEKKKGFLGIGSSEGKIITFQNAEKIHPKLAAAYKKATLA